jgi:hypothetical protein
MLKTQKIFILFYFQNKYTFKMHLNTCRNIILDKHLVSIDILTNN